MTMSKLMQNIDHKQSENYIHVAVAVIVKSNRDVLIALRPGHLHQGGLWEFPGGKIETGETVYQALVRESREELGIDIQSARPYLKIHHNYHDKSVLLDVWKITEFTGNPTGLEGQQIKWQSIATLQPDDFPAANAMILRSLQLPDCYMITGAFDNKEDFQSRLTKALSSGDKIVQLRYKSATSEEEYYRLAMLAREVCKKYNSILLLNAPVNVFEKIDTEGLHLTSRMLFDYHSRPVSANKLLSVSCHNLDEIRQAEKLAVDMILLSPVKETSSHPGVKGIGWERFSELLNYTSVPVYALGGMKVSDLTDARSSGAQGVAAISSFWPDE
ncbi:MAG: Nudix family hydrolase [Gammaproteobacteria bacterium]|nr:Nudix family hydrolase [Gammaproteobacteria bacterium]